MRIDSNSGAQALAENQTAASAASGKAGAPASSTANPLGEDQAEVSGAHAQVQALVGQALQLPEMREERVQTLRQAVASGQYQPSPQDVAGALLSNVISVKLAA